MLQLLTLKRLVAFLRGPASRSFLAANFLYSSMRQSPRARRTTPVRPASACRTSAQCWRRVHKAL